jgi:hypothetical protein
VVIAGAVLIATIVAVRSFRSSQDDQRRRTFPRGTQGITPQVGFPQNDRRRKRDA